MAAPMNILCSATRRGCGVQVTAAAGAFAPSSSASDVVAGAGGFTAIITRAPALPPAAFVLVLVLLLLMLLAVSLRLVGVGGGYMPVPLMR